MQIWNMTWPGRWIWSCAPPARLRPRKSQRTRQASAQPHGLNWSAIDLNLLIVFDALMHEHNLTRAGRRLGLSQPATSHALARLRHMLNDDLFIRSPDGMQPTPRAQQMAEPVRDALRVLRLTLEPEDFDPAKSSRGFTLVVNNYAARAVVPALGAQGRRDRAERHAGHPADRQIEVLEQLDAGGADVALGRLVDGGERFKCVRITDDDYVVCSTGSTLQRERPDCRPSGWRKSRMSS